MRKLMMIFALCILLTGCSSTPTYETLGPIQHVSDTVPQMLTVRLALPEDAAQDVFYGGENALYECDGYILMLQTVTSGNLSQTIASLSGFFPEKLTILESSRSGIKRYDWAWSAVGEDGDMICRASVLDDGNYHYCLSVLTSAADAGALAEEWNGIFASFYVEED